MNASTEHLVEDVNERKNILAQTLKNPQSSSRPIPPQSPRSAGGNIYNGRYKGVIFKSATKVNDEDDEPPVNRAKARAPPPREEPSEEIGLKSLLNERTHLTNKGRGKQSSTFRRVKPIDTDELPVPPPRDVPELEAVFRDGHRPRSRSGCYGSDDEEEKKGTFRQMSFDSALEYLAMNRDCQFLHVTTRRAVELYSRAAFYDLVVLERPGFPESGMVWARSDQKRLNLPKSKLMQLSLGGLLYVDESGDATHIPLKDFQMEREMTKALLQKRFFCFFYEYKIMHHWKKWVRKVKFNRMKNELRSRILIADPPIREALQKLRSINIQTYLLKQIEKIDQSSERLVAMVTSMGDFVHSKYDEVISYTYLKSQIDNVIAHHPLSKGFKASMAKGGDNVDWSQVRGVQRLYNDYLEKITRVLMLGQYMLDHAMVEIMHNFWMRVSQLVAGVNNVSLVESGGGMIATWDITLQGDASVRDNSTYEKARRKLGSAEDSTLLFLANKGGKGPVRTAEDISGQVGNTFISREVRNVGSFLHVDVALVQLNDAAPEEVVINQVSNNWALSQVKVISVPSKRYLLEDLHRLYGALGKMLEDVPNLRHHSLVPREAVIKLQIDLSEDEVDKLEISNKTSATYFENLKVSNVLASAHLFAIAVRCMHQFRNAFTQSIDMENAFQHLNDTFHSVWSLNPELLAKQLDRSQLIVKMKEVIDGDVVLTDDMESALKRDQSRTSVLVKSIEQLKLTSRLKDIFRDIKCTSGVITTFERILSQINSARIYQMHRLFQRLPLTFATRCKLFSNCVSRLKVLYLDERTDLNSLICLLRKLKSFDLSKELFDAEVEICDTIYLLIKQYWEEEGVGDPVEADKKRVEAATKKNPTSPTRRVSIVPAGKQLVSLNLAHREHTRERVELCEAVGRSRMFALNLLKKMGVDILRDMNKLHEDIKKVMTRVSAADVTKMAAAEQKRQQRQRDGIEEEDEGSITGLSVNTHDELSVLSGALLSGTHSTLREIGNAITVLRNRVNDNIRAQQLLNEGHLIVGAAECALEASAMDSFVDMDRLEDFFRSKYQTCTSILEANNTLHRLTSVKLGTCDVTQVYRTYKNTLDTITYLQSRTDSHGTIALLQQLLDSLQPMLELAAFLKSPSLKARHWGDINKRVFKPCDFILTVESEPASIDTVVISDLNVSVGAMVGGDASKRSNGQVIGKIRTMPVAGMVDRGMGFKIGFLKSISAEACVEGLIEQTLDAAADIMHSCTPALSLDWMNDRFINDKLFFQLHRVTNCTQLGIIIQYCTRAVIVAEHTAIDMNIDLFADRIEYMKLVLQDMLNFIRNIDHIQVSWLYLFHHVKYANQGELDRDTERSFQSTSEDIKRIENVMQTANAKSLFAAVQMARDLNMALHNTVQKLEDIGEDVHSSTQSMLDACPRLVMMPYHRTKKLLKCWLTSPYHNIDYVNACLSEMFPGVGHLEIIDNPLQKVQLCLGFTSSDQREKIQFGETVMLNEPIEDFIRKFEFQLRLVLSRSCDMIVVSHIQMLKDMTGDLAVDTLVECLRDVFRLRLSPILKPADKVESDEKPNQSIVLVNQALFAEHVWLALGFPIGSALIARADLNSCKQLLSRQWRVSIHHLIDECSDNVTFVHEALQSDSTSQEQKSLLSTLFQLEISFINTLDELLLSPCLESAIELWAGKYQLRFLYDKSERVNNSPFEVTLGCVSIPYGLEYQGGAVSAITGHRIENALQKVVGSACSFRGTVFFSRDDENTAAEAIGEYAVNCRDVAAALGKVYTTLSTVKNDRGIKLFLSRLIYLDALGCIDFTTLDMDGLHSILATLGELWTAVEKKDDFFMVGTLKYPLKTKQGATTLQMNRRKTNMHSLRQNMVAHGKDGVGFFIVGVASETLYADAAVLDYFSKSTFNIFAVENNRPIEDMGLLLAMSGFKYGALLQMIFQEVIKCLHNKFKYQDNISFLSSSLLIRTIVKQCKAGLVIGKVDLHRLNGGHISDQEELRLEMECLYSAALEQVVLLGQCSKQELSEVHRDVRRVMQEHVNTLLDENCRFQLADSERVTHLVIPQHTRAVLERSMNTLGFIHGGMFLEQAATLYGAVTGSNPLVMVSGPVGCGKSSIIKCVVDGIKREGVNNTTDHANVMALRHWRAAVVLGRAILKWLNSRSKGAPRTASTIKFSNILDTMKSSCNVRTSVIHHASLPMEFLLGSFDAMGRWRDGTLLRKLRQSDQTRVKAGDAESYHIIILQGPIGSHIEQVLAGPFYSTHTAVLPVEMDQCYVNFPSGETCKMDRSVSVIMETSDLSHASPAMLMHTPHVHCGVTPQHCATRLVTVWVKSFGAWVRQFNSWLDTLTDLSTILLRSGFVKDMISCDMLTSEMSSATHLSRVSTFLRYLEELLRECHNLALAESSWQADSVQRSVAELDDNSVGDMSLDEQSTITMEGSSSVVVDTGFPTLNIKEKDKLNVRMRIAVAYASIWGFGGGVNGTDRRQFFDVLAKQCFETYLGPTVPFTHDTMVYELVLDLKNCRFVDSMSVFEPKVQQSSPDIEESSRPQTPVKHLEPVQEKKSEIVDARLKAFVTSTTPGQVPEIVFHTPSSKAFESAFKLLMRTGANMIVTGDQGVGKTLIVDNILKEFGKNCPTPQSMRKDIMGKLLDISCDGTIPDGIPAVLTMIQQVLSTMKHATPVHDDVATETEVWQNIHQSIKDIAAVNTARQHCEKATVFSTCKSLASTSSASELRKWLVRELRSESAGILEPPRETYAVIFIDDLHVLNSPRNTEEAESSRVIENNLECLLKGLIGNIPAFALHRTLLEVDSSVKGLEMPMSSSFDSQLHKEFYTEPRLITRESEESYFITQLGLVAVATGDSKILQSQKAISMLMPYASMMGYPAMSALELRTAGVFGAIECLNLGCYYDPHRGENLSKYIRELVDFTVGTIGHVMKSENQFSGLEKSLMPFCKANLSLITRLCGPLSLAGKHLSRPGDLLDLWTHEWKRNVLDPLPAGGLKSRLMWTWKGRLNRIDAMSWGLPAEELQLLADNLDSTANEKLWVGSDILFGENDMGALPSLIEEESTFQMQSESMDKSSVSEGRGGSYVSILMDDEEFSKQRLAKIPSLASKQTQRSSIQHLTTPRPAAGTATFRRGSGSGRMFSFEEVPSPVLEQEAPIETMSLDLPPIAGNNDLRALLFSQGMSLVLRLVRILSITGGNVLLMGNTGNSAQIGIHLAATLCEMKMMSFDCKGDCADVDTAPSEDSFMSLDFKRFLRTTVLTACGFRRADTQHFTYRNKSAGGDGDEGGASFTTRKNVATYESFAPQRVLLVVNSGQLLSTSDRQRLTSAIYRHNPCELFDEMELEGLVEVARKVATEELMSRKKQLKLQRLISNTVAEENKKKLVHLSGMVTAVDGAEIECLEDDSEEPTAKRMENKGINYAELKFDLTTRKGASILRSSDMQGYTFQWLKRQLSDLVTRNLRVVLCTDVSRAMEFQVISSAQRAIELADRFDARAQSIEGVNKRGMSMNTMGAKNRTLRRFSILSKVALYQQAHSALQPNKGSEHRRFASPSQGAYLPKSNSEYLADIARSANPSDNNLYSCPIIGPMLLRSFHCMRWDVNRAEATRGICHSLMTPNTHLQNESKLVSRLYMSIPYRIGIASSTLPTSGFQIDTTFRRKNFLPLLSELDNLGIFSSFSNGEGLFDQQVAGVTHRRPRSTIAKRQSIIAQTEKKAHRESVVSSTVFLDQAEGCIDSMLLEAESLLAQLLSISLPSDSLLLSQPVLCIETEKCTETACSIARVLLDAGVRLLLNRKQNLEDALAINNDALIVLKSLPSVLELLEATQKQIMIAIRSASSKLSNLSGRLNSSDVAPNDTEEYQCQSETLLMMKEDLKVSDLDVSAKHFAYEKNVSNWRHLVKSIQTKDWVEFGKTFANKYAPKPFVATMHCIMALTGYMTVDREGKSLLEESGVIKLAHNSLRSMDFIGAIASVNPAALTANQIRYLREFNRKLSSDSDSLVQGSEVQASDVEDSTSLSDNSLSSVSQVSSTSEAQIATRQKLVLYLKRLEELYDSNAANNLEKQRVLRKGAELKECEEEIHKARNSYMESMQKQYREREEILHKLDSELMTTKEKILRVNSLMHDEQFLHYNSVFESAEFLKAEIAQLDHILDHIVADVCVASTLLVRAGWLPEQLRAECLDTLRDYLRDNVKVTPSADPFVLGCLLDRLQVRNWSRYTHDHIDRDIPSINSMSLLAMSPMYTYVIDPEGIAEKKLTHLYDEEYETYCTPGSKFSLEDLEGTTSKARSNDLQNLVVIVTDLQAGVSADLVAFLAADVDIYEPLNEQGTGNHSPPASRNRPDNRHGCELRCVLNPSHYNTTYSSRSIRLLSRVRVILVSTHPPTLDSDGIGRPLPPQCYKNVTVVHWVSSKQSNFYIDSKPIYAATNKTYAATCLLESSITQTCLDKISPTHSPKLSLINSRIIDGTMELYCAETAAFSAVLMWSKNHLPAGTERREGLDEYITQPNVTLSFLDNDECCRVLLDSHMKRLFQTRAVFNAKKLERDSLAYRKVFYDASWMSAEFVRFCGMMIPEGILPPYALNCVTLSAKCIKPFIHNSRSKNFVRTIPASFRDLFNVVKAVRHIQLKFRLSRPSSSFSVGSSTSAGTSKRTSIRKKSRARMKSFRGGASPMFGSLKYEDFVHLSMAERDGLIADMNVIIAPFHHKLLSSVFAYVNSVIQPGCEWMAKLCLVLTTWSQASPLPLEEVRALMLLHTNKALTNTLYSITYAPPPAKLNAKNAFSTLVDKGYSRRFHRGQHARAMSVISIAPRTESFWVQSDTPDSTFERKRKESLHHVNDIVSDVEAWQGRGPGPLDGQWINRASQRWRIGYLHSGQEVKRSSAGLVEASSFQSWDPTFCDSKDAIFVPKSLLFIPKARQHDSFLEEWMKLASMRSRHDYSSRGVTSQGVAESRFAATVIQNLKAKNGGDTSKAKAASASSFIRRALGSRNIRKQSIHIASAMQIPVALSVVTTDSVHDEVEESSEVGGGSEDEGEKERLRRFSSAFKDADIPTVKVQSRHTQFGRVGVLTQGEDVNQQKTDSPQKVKGVSNFYDETKGIYNLLTTETAVSNFKLLESHSSLSRVFKGMSMGVSHYLNDFMKWKSYLENLCQRDLLHLSDSDLVHITAEIIPPLLEVAEDPSADGNIGLFASGKELSFLQTLLLVSVVAPVAVESVAQVYFALCSTYLKRGNVILKHRDEFWAHDENSSDDEADEDEEEDEQDEAISTIQEADEEEDEDDEAEDEEEEEGGDTFAQQKSVADGGGNDDGWNRIGDDRFQDGVFDLNCWTKLKRVAGGTDIGRQVRLSRLHTTARSRYRDYQNWERVLLPALSTPLAADKVNVIRHLRNSFEGCGPLFLATTNPHKQMATLTHYASEYASHSNVSNTLLSVINCRRNRTKGAGYDFIYSLIENIQNIKKKKDKLLALKSNVLHDASARTGVAVEMIDLNAGNGNAIIDSVARIIPYDMSAPVELIAAASNPRRMSVLLGGQDTLGKKTVLAALVLSAEWNFLGLRREKVSDRSFTRNWGMGPRLHVSLMHSHWLPKHTVADVIGCTGDIIDGSTGKACALPSQGGVSSSVPLSRMESEGMVREELDTSLLTVMTTLRRVARTRLSKDIQERIRYSTKLEMGCTACTIFIWRTSLFLHSKLKEKVGAPGGWSTCLETLSLWQIARLVLKISDLINSAEFVDHVKEKLSGPDLEIPEKISKTIRQNVLFSRAIHLLAESFCRISFNGDNIGIARTMSNVYEGQPMSARTARARLSVLIKTDSSIGINAEDFLSRYKANHSSSADKKKIRGSPRSPSPNKVHVAASGSGLNSLPGTAENSPRPFSQGGPQPKRPAKEKPSEVRKRKREQAKSEAAAEASASANFMSFDSLSSLSLHALGPNRRHYVSDEYRARLCASLSNYLSDVISVKMILTKSDASSRLENASKKHQQQQQPRTTAQTLESASPIGAETKSPFVRKQAEFKDFGERWPRILSQNGNVTIGTLSSDEVMNVLVAWTFRDDSDSKDGSMLLKSYFNKDAGRRNSQVTFSKIRKDLISKASMAATANSHGGFKKSSLRVGSSFK